jgi:hypothetical protein
MSCYGEVKEGDHCPNCTLGTIKYEQESCYCHRGNPPCSNCVNAWLECTYCGWLPEDDLEIGTWYDISEEDCKHLTDNYNSLAGVREDVEYYMEIYTPDQLCILLRNHDKKTPFRRNTTSTFLNVI